MSGWELEVALVAAVQIGWLTAAWIWAIPVAEWVSVEDGEDLRVGMNVSIDGTAVRVVKVEGARMLVQPSHPWRKLLRH